MSIDAAHEGRQAPVVSPHVVRHVYHVSWSRLLWLPLLWCAVVAPLSALASSAGSTPEEARAFLLAALIFTLILLPFFALIWQSRLVLTPQGIAQHQFGYTIRSRWDNVQALSLASGAQCLILDQPGTRSRLLRWSTGLLRAVVPSVAEGIAGHAGLLAEGRLILLLPYMAHWKRGPLRDDLRRFAPQLFDADM